MEAAVGPILREIRKNQGVTQMHLAKNSMIPQTTISDMELGRYDLPMGEFINLCRVLNVSPHKVIKAAYRKRGKPEDNPRTN